METYRCLMCGNITPWAQRSRRPKYVMTDGKLIHYKEEVLSSWHLCIGGVEARWTKCERVIEEKDNA